MRDEIEDVLSEFYHYQKIEPAFVDAVVVSLGTTNTLEKPHAAFNAVIRVFARHYGYNAKEAAYSLFRLLYRWDEVENTDGRINFTTVFSQKETHQADVLLLELKAKKKGQGEHLTRILDDKKLTFGVKAGVVWRVLSSHTSAERIALQWAYENYGGEGLLALINSFPPLDAEIAANAAKNLHWGLEEFSELLYKIDKRVPSVSQPIMNSFLQNVAVSFYTPEIVGYIFYKLADSKYDLTRAYLEAKKILGMEPDFPNMFTEKLIRVHTSDIDYSMF